MDAAKLKKLDDIDHRVTDEAYRLMNKGDVLCTQEVRDARWLITELRQAWKRFYTLKTISTLHIKKIEKRNEIYKAALEVAFKRHKSDIYGRALKQADDE